MTALKILIGIAAVGTTGIIGTYIVKKYKATTDPSSEGTSPGTETSTGSSDSASTSTPTTTSVENSGQGTGSSLQVNNSVG